MADDKKTAKTESLEAAAKSSSFKVLHGWIVYGADRKLAQAGDIVQLDDADAQSLTKSGAIKPA